jgi:hypothetical protein
VEGRHEDGGQVAGGSAEAFQAEGTQHRCTCSLIEPVLINVIKKIRSMPGKHESSIDNYKNGVLSCQVENATLVALCLLVALIHSINPNYYPTINC